MHSRPLATVFHFIASTFPTDLRDEADHLSSLFASALLFPPTVLFTLAEIDASLAKGFLFSHMIFSVPFLSRFITVLSADSFVGPCSCVTAGFLSFALCRSSICTLFTLTYDGLPPDCKLHVLKGFPRFTPFFPLPFSFPLDRFHLLWRDTAL